MSSTIVNLKQIRKSKNLTQADLARLSGIGRAIIVDIENNTHLPRVDIAIKIARSVGATVEEIFVIKE